MRLSESHLKEIIKEELRKMFSEADEPEAMIKEPKKPGDMVREEDGYTITRTLDGKYDITDREGNLIIQLLYMVGEYGLLELGQSKKFIGKIPAPQEPYRPQGRGGKDSQVQAGTGDASRYMKKAVPVPYQPPSIRPRGFSNRPPRRWY